MFARFRGTDLFGRATAGRPYGLMHSLYFFLDILLLFCYNRFNEGVKTKDCERMSTMKKTPKLFWLWMPIVNCMLLVLGYSVFYILMDPYRRELGAVVFALLFILFYAVIVVPLMSVFYCKKICKMGRAKYLCCLYNAVMMGMYITLCLLPFNSFNLRFIMNSVLSIPWLSVFISSLICAMITLIVYEVKAYHRKRNNAS